MDTSIKQAGEAVQGAGNVADARLCKWCDKPLEADKPHPRCEEAERNQGKLFNF